MTVNITTSATSAGDSLADTVELNAVDGALNPGENSDHQEVFISHDAVVASITDCALYITRYAGSNYLGADAGQDIIDLLGSTWGGADKGARMSMTPPGSWVLNAIFTSGWASFKTGYGDVDSEIPLAKESIVVGTPPASDGEIPVGGEAHIQIRVDAPLTAAAGYKAFSLVFAYSATS